MADEARGYYARAVPPRGHAHAAGQGAARTASCSTSPARKPDWVMRDHIDEAVARIREQVGDEEVILGLSGGVDSSVAAALIHRAIGDQLTCVFVDHGLLRLNEGQHGDGHVRRPAAREGDPRRRERAVPRPAGRRDRPGSQAQDHRPRVRRGVPGRGREARAQAPTGEVAGAGHDLPRRDRVGRRQEQEGHHDQEPPQRRRPARDAGPEAAGAAARPVQGRGARAGRGARPAARDGLSPSVPGPGPGRAHPGRGEEGVRRPAAPRRRHLHRGAAQLHATPPPARAGTT